MRNPLADPTNEFRSYAQNLVTPARSPYAEFVEALSQMDGQPQSVREQIMAEIRIKVAQKYTS